MAGHGMVWYGMVWFGVVRLKNFFRGNAFWLALIAVKAVFVAVFFF